MLLTRHPQVAAHLWRGAGQLPARVLSVGAPVTTEADVNVQLYDLPPYDFNEQELQVYNAAVEVITRLKAYGHPATYICGGWVRDKYLQRPSLDIDITTSCDANTVRRLFRRTQVLPRNTVRVLHEDGSSQFEVTTFRGYSRSNDHLSACLDAEMRDFTMNALFYDTEALKVMDFVGGVPDLQRRVLRLCRDPRARLQEDPLRVLRGLRFATSMRFKLSPDTAQAMRLVGPLCSPEQGVPPGRIWKELQKMNSAEAATPGSFMAAMRLAFHLGFLRHILPFLATEEALAKAVAAAEKLPAELPLELRLAAMMHPSAKLDDYLQITKRFSLGATERGNIELLHQLADMCMGGGGLGSADGAAGGGHLWVQFYSHPNSGLCQKVLEAWMPKVVLQQFQSFHDERRAELAEPIAAARQLREQAMDAARKADLQRRQSSRTFSNARRGTSPRVGDLLPREYLEAIVNSFSQRGAPGASDPPLPPPLDSRSSPPGVANQPPAKTLPSPPDSLPHPAASTSHPGVDAHYSPTHQSAPDPPGPVPTAPTHPDSAAARHHQHQPHLQQHLQHQQQAAVDHSSSHSSSPPSGTPISSTAATAASHPFSGPEPPAPSRAPSAILATTSAATSATSSQGARSFSTASTTGAAPPPPGTSSTVSSRHMATSCLHTPCSPPTPSAPHGLPPSTPSPPRLQHSPSATTPQHQWLAPHTASQHNSDGVASSQGHHPRPQLAAPPAD